MVDQQKKKGVAWVDASGWVNRRAPKRARCPPTKPITYRSLSAHPSMSSRTSGARALATLVVLLSCVSFSRAFVSGTTRPTTTSGCRHTAVRGQPLPLGRVSVSSRPRSPVVASPPRTPPGLRSADDDSQGGDGGDGLFGGETI